MAFKKGNIPWNKNLKGIHLSPKSEFKRGMIAPMKGRKFSEGHKRKLSKIKLARYKDIENHPRWIKDRTQVKQYWTERNNPEYKQWRKNCKERDNYKCRIGDSSCFGKIIVHHILGWTQFPELRYKINNGITLCHFHHPRTRVEEQRLIPTFIRLVEVIRT